MTNPGAVLQAFNNILALCPCCGDVLRLGDLRVHSRGKRIPTELERVDAEERRLDDLAERLEDAEERLREKARALGQKDAKRRLRRVDPMFTTRGIDVQDVKVIFDPIEYVAFRGLCRGKVKELLLMAHPPSGSAQEKSQASVERCVRKGNLEFATLRVSEDGTVQVSEK